MIFDGLIGQEKAISRLKGYVDSQMVDGAYLFTGPAGVGKALAALIFAKALNCATPGSYGCDSCVSCRKIDNGGHPDIHIIDSEEGQSGASFLSGEGSGQIKIAAIRALQEDINYRPYEGRKKVFIINNAHLLNLDSANAFLKTLEEPPRDSLIILVTERPVLLLPTVLSRCRIVKFYPMARSVLKDTLMARTAGGDPIGAAEAHFLAYFSEGSLGVSLKLRSQGLFGQKNRIIDLFCSIGKQADDPASLASRQDLLSSFNILVSWFRDIYMLKSGVVKDDLIHADRLNELESLAGVYSFSELDRIIALLSDSVLHVGRNLNKKLLVSNVIVACKQSHPAFV
ncbi:MAG: DNA polymerase III subunit delta' C-terminal domain-containing protein [Candidatus Omnitrophota bacterium]